MERVETVMGELARLALKLEPDHTHWRAVAALFPPSRALSQPLLHWTRLAQAIPQDGRVNAAA